MADKRKTLNVTSFEAYNYVKSKKKHWPYTVEVIVGRRNMKMDIDELNSILHRHKLWLEKKGLGERADLSGADLRGANLRDRNLKSAIFNRADLRGADLRGADLRDADLRNAVLDSADMRGTIMNNTPKKEQDVVNSPPHYNNGGIECIDAIEAAGFQYQAYHKSNVMKYLWRSEYKGKELEDLKKARWYLDRAISNLESLQKTPLDKAKEEYNSKQPGITEKV